MNPSEVINTSLYLRLSAELWLIALAIYSLRVMFRKSYQLFGFGLLTTLVCLFIVTGITYFIPNLELSRYITAILFTPALFFFAVLWMLALIFTKDKDE